MPHRSPAPAPRPARAPRALGLSRLALVLGAVVAGAGAPGRPAAADAPAGAALSRPSVPARGLEAVDLHVYTPGRYALFATSPQGSALELVDRAAGPLAGDGFAGERNGRVDAWLAAGDYRLRVRSRADGDGEARVEARPYEEQNPPRNLPFGTSLETTLQDLELRSWWIVPIAGEPLSLELGGRSLTGVELRDAAGVPVAAEVRCRAEAPRPAHPILRCTVDGPPAGQPVRITAVGGPARPWTDGAPEEPLWVKRGGVPLAAWATRITVGESGTHRLRPARSSALRVEVPAGSTLAASFLADGARAPSSAAITADRRLPAALLSTAGKDGTLQLSAPPGTEVSLRLVPPVAASSTLKPGTWWVATHLAEDPRDRADLTGLVAERGGTNRVLAEQVVQLSKAAPYRRRFNASGTVRLLLRAEPGEWEIRCPGADLSAEPYLLGPRPDGMVRPAPVRDALGLGLDDRLWELTLTPRTTNPLQELVIKPRGAADPAKESPPLGAFVVGPLTVEKAGAELRLEGTGATAGLDVRPWPLTLDTPLAVPLAAGERRELALAPAAAGRPLHHAPDGIVLAVDGAAAPARVPPGATTLLVENRGDAPVTAWIGPAPTPVPPPTDWSPPAAARTVATGPQRVQPGVQVGLDLAVEAEETRSFVVTEPGLWSVSTDGLLAVGLKLLDESGAAVADAAENGPGRNAHVEAWLDRGEYHTTVTARGESAGHLRLLVRRLGERDAGRVEAPGDGWSAAAAGEAVSHILHLPTDGDWTIAVEALAGDTEARLEDPDGWPMLPPGTWEDPTLALPAGDYRLVLLPEPFPVRRRVRVSTEVPTARPEGHGPHELALPGAASAVWWDDRLAEVVAGLAEAPAAGPAAPDQWRFLLPADATAHLDLGGDARLALVGADRDGACTGAAKAGVGPRSWSGRLEAGAWCVLVSAEANAVPYTLSLRTDELLAGQRREVPVGTPVALRVGSAGWYRLDTDASRDLRLRLTTPEGAVVLAEDDGVTGWLPAPVAWLEPGDYRAELRGPAVPATLALTPVQDGPTLPWDGAATHQELPDHDRWVRRSLPTRPDGLLRVEVHAAQPVTAALAAGDGPGVLRTGTDLVLLLRAGTSPPTLRLLSRAGDAGADLRATWLPVGTTNERTLTTGTKPRGEDTVLAPLLTRGGLFRLPEGPGLMRCGPDGACVEVGGRDVMLRAATTPAEADWLVAAAGSPLRGARVVLGEGTTTVLHPVDAELELDLTAPDPRAAAAMAGGAGPAPSADPVAPAGRAPPPRALVHLVAHAEAGPLAAGLVGSAGRVPTGAERPVAWGSVQPAVEAPSAAVAGWAAALDPTPRARLRLDPALSTTVEVRAASLWLGPDEALPLGTADGVLSPGAARALRLPSAPWSVGLTLGEGGVALAPGPGEQPLVVHAPAGPRAATFLSHGGTLLLVNPTAAPLPWRTRTQPTPTTRPSEPVTREAAWEQSGGPAGVREVDVVAREGEVLHLLGEAELVVALPDGSVRRGASVPLSGVRTGVVAAWLWHGTGPVGLWVESPTPGAPGLWGVGAPPPPPRDPASLPAQLGLAGPLTHLVLQAPADGLLRVRAPAAPMAQLLGEGGARLALPDAEGAFEWPVAEGARSVVLRAPAGGTLGGDAAAELLPLRPLGPGDDGVLGAEPVLLPPGAAAAWRFALDRPRTVGTTAVADGPGAHVRLYSADGRRLAAGAQTYGELPAGAYVLVIAADPAGRPLSVRPVVAGATDPPPPAPEPPDASAETPRAGSSLRGRGAADLDEEPRE